MTSNSSVAVVGYAAGGGGGGFGGLGGGGFGFVGSMATHLRLLWFAR
jgi:hypothetical protein